MSRKARTGSVIPRRLGDEESAFHKLMNAHKSGFLAKLGMTLETFGVIAFQTSLILFVPAVLGVFRRELVLQ